MMLTTGDRRIYHAFVTMDGQTVNIAALQPEDRWLEYVRRRPNSPASSPLLALTSFMKMMFTVMLLLKEVNN